MATENMVPPLLFREPSPKRGFLKEAHISTLIKEEQSIGIRLNQKALNYILKPEELTKK